jgi:hypothetical protein
MKPISVDGITYRCSQEDVWPPAHSKIGDAETIRGQYSELVYARMKTWEALCGLTDMDASKCMTCPFLRDALGKPLESSPPRKHPPMYNSRRRT